MAKQHEPADGIPVRATRRGYFGGVLFEEGDRFVIPDDKALGSWMAPINPKDAERLAERLKKLNQHVRPPPPKGVRPTTGPGFIGSFREPVGDKVERLPESEAKDDGPKG